MRRAANGFDQIEPNDPESAYLAFRTLEWIDKPDDGVQVRMACCTDGKCSVTPVDKLHDCGEPAWCQVRIVDKAKASKFLQQKLHLPDYAVDRVLSDVPSQELRRFDGHWFLSWSRPVEPGCIDTQERHAMLDPKRLITITQGADAEQDALFERWTRKHDDFGHSAAMLLYVVLDNEADDLNTEMDRFEDLVEEDEDNIYIGKTGDIRAILAHKKSIYAFRRSAISLREVLNSLLHIDAEIITGEERVYMREVYDLTLRLVERVEINRDVLGDMLDAHQNLVSNQLNEVMKVLTVISTFMMSVSLITGWYGMNFEHMPELHFKYSYLFIVSLCTVVVLVEAWLFRRKRWI